MSVTGPGGVGKTRFTLAAAGEAADRFPDGVWFVALAPLRDPQLVLPSIAKAVGAEADLLRHVDGLECLLLLDNFESVIGAASDIAALAAAAPSVRMLVTSREPLRIAVEREYRLRPLPESPAVELFRQRADAVADVDVAYDVAAEICERLDRLPLAIELAAARMTVFDPEVLLERLERRLPLLVSRARDMPERQRTLHSTIAWSYELLEPMEQRFFRRLAVFRGGATLEAIERVAEGDAELVESLVDKSLLRRRGQRFFMLETIREFALERARCDRTRQTETRRRHAEFFLEVATSANLNAGHLRPGGQRLDIAIAEQDNIRAALDWAITSRTRRSAFDSPCDGQFWVVNDPYREQAPVRGALRPVPTTSMPPSCARHSDHTRSSLPHLGRSRGRICGCTRRAFDVLRAVGRRARSRCAAPSARHPGDARGDLERARELVEQSHAIHERHGDTWGLAQTVGTLGAIERDAGNGRRLRADRGQRRSVAEAVGVLWWQAGMLMELAALVARGGPARGRGGARPASRSSSRIKCATTAVVCSESAYLPASRPRDRS